MTTKTIHELDAKSGSALLKQMLRAAFPMAKFSVRCSFYSGGSSISARYTDGPPLVRTREIADNFKGKGFDGMTDCSYTIDHTFTFLGQTYKAPHCYVDISRDVTEPVRAKVRELLANCWADWDTITENEQDRRLWNALRFVHVHPDGGLTWPEDKDLGDMSLYGS